MSIKLKTEFDGRNCVVEFFRDGEMIIHGIDQEQINYELSLVEFGDPQSELLRFMEINSMYGIPSAFVIFRDAIDFSKYYKETVMYLIDCAKHAIGICLEHIDNEAFVACEEVIKISEAALESYIGTGDGQHTEKLRSSIRSYIKGDLEELIDAAEEFQDLVTEYILRAVRVAAFSSSSLVAVADGSVERMGDGISYSAGAVAWTGSDDASKDLLEQKEEEWQYRRFVDCFEAVQEGKQWPPLGATK